MKTYTHKCRICGFPYQELVLDCPKCLFRDRHGYWVDLRKKEDRIAFWKDFGHWTALQDKILHKGDIE